MTKKELTRKELLHRYKTEIKPFKETVVILMVSLVCLIIFFILSSNWDISPDRVGELL
jgi:hypothetical protein